MKKDYSEFQYSDYDRYRAIRDNTRDMRLDFYQNIVSFSEEKKQLIIYVDEDQEFDFMDSDLEKYKQELIARNDGSYEAYCETESSLLAYFEVFREQRPRLIAQIKERFGYDLSDVNNFFKTWPVFNLFNGKIMHLNFGEGILDFLYADFNTPVEEALSHFSEKRAILDALIGEDDANRESKKIYSHTQARVEDFLQFGMTFSFVQDIAYQSLYSAICPPLFTDLRSAEKALRRYGEYLQTLQKEYLEIIKFCYDESFFPCALGKLMPHERYLIYRAIRHLPTIMERRERIQFSHHYMGHKLEMPYGMDEREIGARLTAAGTVPTEEEKQFAASLGIDAGQTHYHIGMPSFICIEYAFSTVESILELEFTKMLEQNVRFRKCKRCGKYFIMKGNYDTNYCDRVAEGSTQTCQQLASQENYKARNADNKAIPIYSKYYKRYAARVRVNQIKEKDFNAWRYQAILKRDECTNGKITPEELTEWMEASFPNRKPRKPKEEKE